MSKIQKAYIAGFLDGEGSIMALIEPNRECKYNYRIRPVIQFYQHTKHRTVLEEIKRIFGYGYISKSNKNVDTYVIKSNDAVEKTLNDLIPYLRIKKGQALLMLQLIAMLRNIEDKKSFIKAARFTDKISELNLKSRSRRKHFGKDIDI